MDSTIQGGEWPPYLRKILQNPASLRARAEVRRSIARQDSESGRTWEAYRNIAEAARLEGKAYALEGKGDD